MAMREVVSGAARLLVQILTHRLIYVSIDCEAAATKLQLLDARIRELRQLPRELAGVVAGCDANVEDSTCPLIERLGGQARSAR